MRETQILKDCLVDVSKLPGVRCWRNNTGALIDRDGRLVHFGLKGSADILGLRMVLITPDMVGQSLGQFISIETKSPGKKQTDQQRKFEAMVTGLGGIYAVAHSADEAVAALTLDGKHNG